MPKRSRTILAVFAHPDDESMGPGATLAKYAAAGHRVLFVTATDGGAGRLYKTRPDDNADLRMRRREETVAAAEVLGVEFLGFLGWQDRMLAGMNILDIEVEFAQLIRREKPDVVLTFHGAGISGHPDHRVVALALGGAFLGSGWKAYYPECGLEALPPYRASRLYHYTVPEGVWDEVGWPRKVYASPEAEVTTVIDTRETADVKWRAIQAHDSQRDGPPFKLLYDAGVFEKECFVRVFPSWRPGESREDDLLSGL